MKPDPILHPPQWAFLMDAYETLNLETETSLLLMEELLASWQRVLWMEATDLFLENGVLMADVAMVNSASPLQLGHKESINLDEVDVVVNRLDPPFNTKYLQITQLLSFLSEKVLQINPPAALRELNEKLLPMQWPEYSSETLISSNPEHIYDFVAEHGTAVLKPLNDCSGRGINKLDKHQPKVMNEIKQALGKDQEQWLIQKFIPEVNEGDKRVYWVNGEVVGMVNRIPQNNSFLANIHQGAKVAATQLTLKERRILKNITPFLKQHHIMLAGIDFIGEKLTEVNITSPSAVRQINQVMGQPIHKLIVAAMLEVWHQHQLAFAPTKVGFNKLGCCCC